MECINTSIWQYKKNDPNYLISNYLVKNNYNNFFYVGTKNFFTNSTEIHLYDKVWYKYYDHKKVIYIPFKLNSITIKLVIASTHMLNLYS